MAAEDRRFEITINLTITENNRPFFANEANYSDVPYEGVVAIEGILANTAQNLMLLAEGHADTLGLTDKLNQLKSKLRA